MNKLLISAMTASILLGSTSVMAGEDGKHHARQHRGDGVYHAARLEQKLNLSAEQQTQISDIRESIKQSRQAQRRAAGVQQLWRLDPESEAYQQTVAQLARQRGEQAEQAFIQHAKAHAEIHAVLTPEQREQLKAMRANKKSKRSTFNQ